MRLREVEQERSQRRRGASREAVGRPSMRFVPQKSSDQLALQAVHRVRQRLVSDRTRLVSQIRGLLAKHGIAIARDISRLRSALAQIVDGGRTGLGDLIFELVRDAREDLEVRNDPSACYGVGTTPAPPHAA